MPQTRVAMVALWGLLALMPLRAHPAGGDFEGVPLGRLPDGWLGEATVVATETGQGTLCPEV